MGRCWPWRRSSGIRRAWKQRWRSSANRESRLDSRHGVDDDVHRELRVVLRAEALVAPVVIPLAAVVLVRVQDAQPALPLDAAQIVVHDVVAPAIELMARLRRSLRKTEKRPIQAMAVRELRHRALGKRALHLGHE